MGVVTDTQMVAECHYCSLMGKHLSGGVSLQILQLVQDKHEIFLNSLSCSCIIDVSNISLS